jgi:hypothetical protein
VLAVAEEVEDALCGRTGAMANKRTAEGPGKGGQVEVEK